MNEHKTKYKNTEISNQKQNIDRPNRQVQEKSKQEIWNYNNQGYRKIV